jgi:hypothetical protein
MTYPFYDSLYDTNLSERFHGYRVGLNLTGETFKVRSLVLKKTLFGTFTLFILNRKKKLGIRKYFKAYVSKTQKKTNCKLLKNIRVNNNKEKSNTVGHSFFKLLILRAITKCDFLYLI